MLGLQQKACLPTYGMLIRKKSSLTRLAPSYHDSSRLAASSRVILADVLTPAHLRFICNNYSLGDEIFLFGFSRGAFTARSIAGLISGVGLLTKAGLPYLAEVFKDFENRKNLNYRPLNPDIPFPNKPSASDPMYDEELQKRDLSRLDIDVKVVGVFDTVGSLGIPRIPWLERLRLQTRSTKEFLFYDTNLNNHIENAFQALALDEHRASFSVRRLMSNPSGL